MHAKVSTGRLRILSLLGSMYHGYLDPNMPTSKRARAPGSLFPQPTDKQMARGSQNQRIEEEVQIDAGN